VPGPEGASKKLTVPPPANVLTPVGKLTSAEDGYQGLAVLRKTYRKLNALALFVIDMVRFIRALLTPSAAVYLNEGGSGTEVNLYSKHWVLVITIIVFASVCFKDTILPPGFHADIYTGAVLLVVLEDLRKIEPVGYRAPRPMLKAGF